MYDSQSISSTDYSGKLVIMLASVALMMHNYTFSSFDLQRLIYRNVSVQKLSFSLYRQLFERRLTWIYLSRDVTSINERNDSVAGHGRYSQIGRWGPCILEINKYTMGGGLRDAGIVEISRSHLSKLETSLYIFFNRSPRLFDERGTQKSIATALQSGNSNEI